eukprot:5337368-Pyramimonas_sp.AAC.1
MRCSRGSTSAPQGGTARGFDICPFAPRLWGCLKRLDCVVAWISLSQSPCTHRDVAGDAFEQPPGGRTFALSRPDSEGVSCGVH